MNEFIMNAVVGLLCLIGASIVIVSVLVVVYAYVCLPWSRQLVVMPPQSARWLEQIYGRSHRSGADRPVHITILLTSGGTIDLFETAVREARASRGIVSMTQKVLRAEIHRARPRRTKLNRYRWANKEGLYDGSDIWEVREGH